MWSKLLSSMWGVMRLGNSPTADEAEVSLIESEAASRGRSFFADYKLINGISTRVLRPGTNSSFTCHAQSKDGELFATGEKNGNITLWSTKDYTRIAQTSTQFERPLSSLVLVGDYGMTIRAIDTKGNFCQLTCSEQFSPSDASLTCEITLDWSRDFGEAHENGSRLPFKIRAHQFSEDGTLLACVHQHAVYRSVRIIQTRVDLCRLDEHEDILASVEIESPQICYPVLSKDGASLLVTHFRESTSIISTDSNLYEDRKIWVYPELEFKLSEQRCVKLTGDRACWGLRGEYLLVWDALQLSVYKRKSLYSRGESARPFRQRKFAAVSEWRAQMLEPTKASLIPDVLVYESNPERKSCFIWSMADDAMKTEVKMAMQPRLMPSGEAWGQYCSSWQSFSRRSPEDFCRLAEEDAFPAFCATPDKNWIAAFSREMRTGTLSSVRSGVTAWMLDLAKELELDPTASTLEVKLDSRECHLMVIGDSAIFAFAPPFLWGKTSAAKTALEQSQSFTCLDSLTERKKLLDAYRRLPSEGLRKTWEARGLGQHALSWFQRHRMKNSEYVECMDASLSPDGDLLAIIARKSDGSSCIRLLDSSPGESAMSADMQEIKLPNDNAESSRELLSPERIILYTAYNGDEKMALLSCGPVPEIIFHDMSDEAQVYVSLPVTECVSWSQSEDLNSIMLLDKSTVHVLSLWEEKLVDKVDYLVDFVELMPAVQDSLQWSRKQDHDCGKSTERRISDDGRAVLLGWDVHNDRSILVTPSMAQKECEDLIRSTDRLLSDFCLLFSNGTRTAYMDVNALGSGQITIGIFNETERTIVCRIEVQRSVTKCLEQRTEIWLLSNVFYGFSEDGSELITLTPKFQSTRTSENFVGYQMKRFTTAAATDCIPDYELRNLRGMEETEETCEELFERHGFDLFNTPMANGMTVFQEAFFQKDKQMVEGIKKLAERHNVELSLEWVQASYPSCDILRAALQTQSTNNIREAIELVCASVAPFNSAAEILKKSFSRLTMDYPDIVEEVICGTILVSEMSQLEVHVDFLDPKLRRDQAVHIGTSDTYLEWIPQTSEDSKAVLAQVWKDRNQDVVKKMESGGNKSTTMATLKFVRIADAAKVGMHGILRPLLLHKFPVKIFECDVMKWLVMHKWIKVWRGRFLRNAGWYALFLLFFCLYASFLARSDSVPSNDDWEGILLWCLLACVSLFGVFMTISEVRQIRAYMNEGEKWFERRWKGVVHYTSFKWNWVDLSSCLLLILISFFHILTTVCHEYNEVLSVFVALEAIVAFAKVWYFAQPFKRSGALVRMIKDIVLDCLAFLLLSCAVLIGFSFALHVMFRHATQADDENGITSSETATREEEEPDVAEAFGTTWRSILTLFYALLGDFNQEIYLSAGNLSWLTTLTFVSYMLSQMIVLLNLLISIMADTFDKVRSNENAQLLLGRAEFMDSCEAALSESECESINRQIGQYLYVLEDADPHHTKDTDEWGGRIQKIESCIGKGHEKIELEWNRFRQELEPRITRLEATTSLLSEQMHQLRRELKNESDANATKLAEIIALLRQQ